MLVFLLALISYIKTAHLLREYHVLEYITSGHSNNQQNEQIHLVSLLNAIVSCLGLSWSILGYSWLLGAFQEITLAYFFWDTTISILHHLKSPASIKKYHIMFLTILHHVGTAMFVCNIGLGSSSEQAILGHQGLKVGDQKSSSHGLSSSEQKLPLLGYYIADITTFIVFRTWLAITRKENELDIKFLKRLELLVYFAFRVVCLPMCFVFALPSISAITLSHFVVYAIYIIVYGLNIMWFVQIWETDETYKNVLENWYI